MADINAFLTAVSDFALATAGQPWVYLVVVIACVIDGFFPPFPSESIVAGLAALAITPVGPDPWLLILAAALGAFLGDNIAYSIGRRVGVRGFRWMRGRWMQQTIARVGQELDHRAVQVILVARFVPIGRVAVNLAAGATGYSRKRFAAIAALSATVWAAYTVGIGAVAGTWFHENQLVGVIAAIAIAAVIGFAVDRVAGKLRGKSKRQTIPDRASAREPDHAGALSVAAFVRR